MTRDEIVAATGEAHRERQRARLCERLRQSDDAEVFRALFPIATDAQRHGPAYDAACLLFAVKPACPIPCKDAVRGLLPNWDISIEEVPWYLAGQFGKETIRQAIEDLNKEPLGHEHRVRLGTVLYWADTFFALAPEQLQELERRAVRMDE
jgi:hypothetical protein